MTAAKTYLVRAQQAEYPYETFECTAILDKDAFDNLHDWFDKRDDYFLEWDVTEMDDPVVGFTMTVMAIGNAIGEPEPEDLKELP